MSKEAMQAAALFAASGKIPAGSALGCLTWMAYFSRDTEAPYTSYVSPATLGKLLNLQERQVREIVETLKAAGVVEAGKDARDKRKRIYIVHLPEPDQLEYSQLFAPPEYRRYSADIEQEIPAIQRRNPEQYRRYSADSTGDWNENTGDTAPKYRRYSAVSTYKEKYEKREEKEEQTITPSYDNLARQRNTEAEAEETPSPLPPSPKPAKATWQHMREALREEISETQTLAWLRQIQPSWLPDGALLLQAHSSYAAEMITSRYSERLLLAAERVIGRPVDIEIRAGRTEARRDD